MYSRKLVARALTLSIFSLFLIHAAQLHAAKFHMSDGNIIEASYIGEADSLISLLNKEGKVIQVKKHEIMTVDWKHKLSKSLEKKALKVRSDFAVKRRKDAKKIVRKIEKAKDSIEQEKHFQKLKGFQEHELIPALDYALRSESASLREKAITQVMSLKTKSAVIPLVNANLLSKDREYGKRLHELALSKNKETSRKLYEYVASVGEPDQRLTAIQALESIQDVRSTKRLVKVLTHVQMTIRATLARSKGLKEIPARFGGNNVNLELPELEVIQVVVTTIVPLRKLEAIEMATVHALEGISGEAYGNQPKKWAKWVKANTKGLKRTRR